MTTFFILLGILLSSIIILTVQIKSAQKKEIGEIEQLFKEPNQN